MKYTSMTRNNDFLRAYKKGVCIARGPLVLYCNKNRARKTRVGITASKKIGNAVTRNRAKRVIIHALYEVLPENAGPYDLVFVARAKTPGMKSTALAPVVREMLKKAGILNPD